MVPRKGRQRGEALGNSAEVTPQPEIRPHAAGIAVNRSGRYVFFLGLAAAGLYFVIRTGPVRTGDGFEYYYQNQSLFNHLSPALRPEDAADFQEIVRRSNPHEMIPDNIYAGYVRAADSGYYSIHFFAYPLVSLPAKELLHTMHLNEMRVLELTNLGLCLLAILAILLLEEHWVLLAAFVFIGPVSWYLKSTGPELMIYCLFAISLICSRKGRYLLASTSAAVAAAQFVVLLPWLVFLLYFMNRKPAQPASTVLRPIVTAALLLVGLSSVVFYLTMFHTPSMIVKAGFASVRFITPGRMLDLVTDLNFGLVLFYPSIVLLIFGVWKRYRLEEIALAIAVVIYFILVSGQLNWNSGMAMINRYGLMIAPAFLFILFWRAAEMPSWRWILGLALALNLGSFIFFSFHGYRYQEFGPVAKAALRYIPRWYNPDVEIFAERSLHAEINPLSPPCMPVYYFGEPPNLKVLVPGPEHEDRVRFLPGASTSFSLPRLAGWSLQYPRYENISLNMDSLTSYGIRRCPEDTIALIPLIVPRGDSCSIRSRATSVQVPIIIVNRTNHPIGGPAHHIGFKLVSAAGEGLGWGFEHTLEIPILASNSAAFTLLTISGVNRYWIPSITYGIFVEEKGWENALVVPMSTEAGTG